MGSDRRQVQDDALLKQVYRADQAGKQVAGGCLGLAALVLLGTSALVIGVVAGLKFHFGESGAWVSAAEAVVLAALALWVWRWLGKDRPEPVRRDDAEGLQALRDTEQASGRITGVGLAASELQLWAAALLVVVVWGGLLLAWNAAWASGWGARAGLIAVAIGATTFALKAMRQSRRARAGGGSSLQLATPSPAPGGSLKGRISIGLAGRPRQVHLRLLCQHILDPLVDEQGQPLRHRTSMEQGNFHHKRITELWASERELDAALLSQAGRRRWSVPVEFDIPSDARCSSDEDARDRIQWVLRLHALCDDGGEQTDAWEVRVSEISGSDPD